MMTRHTWISNDVHLAMASEIDELVQDQAFLEQFFAASLLLHELGRGLDDETTIAS